MDLLSMIVDVLIILMLIYTVYRAQVLSRNLTNFNKSKKELNLLITDVSNAITKADVALKEFKENINSTGKTVDKKISEAKMLSDELELIMQSSNRVADRLERLMDSSPSEKKNAGKASSSGAAEKKTKAQVKEEATNPNKGQNEKVGWIAASAAAKKEGPSFAIRDPEFEGGLKEDAKTSDENWDGPEELESEAERALFKALKGK